jgi:multiple sugar transport system permease protein
MSTTTRNQRRQNWTGWAMASPWIIGFLLFTLGPIILSLVVSFTEWNLLNAPKFIGLDNYKKMMFEDPKVWKSVAITTTYSFISVPLHLILGLMLAILLNRKIRGLKFWRTIYYLPTIISGVAVSLLWQWVFSPDFGVLNYMLSLIGFKEKINWLGDEGLVLPSLILMSLWTLGSSMVINLAGLQNIPTSLYESAKVDGANRFQQIMHVTVPMMTPIIFLNLVTGLIASFQTFTSAYVMTGGGPNEASLFFMMYLYFNAFEFFKMGYASALAWMLFLYISLLTALVFISGKRWVHYEGEEANR